MTPPLRCAALVLAAACPRAAAQSATRPAALPELDVDGFAVTDYTFNFDEPLFYEALRAVRRLPPVPASAPATPATPTSTKFLLARPSEFRGRPVVVQGRVLSSQAYALRNAAGEDFGTVLETELRPPDSPAICTVVTTADELPLPLGANVRAEGYFVKVRAFHTTDGAQGTGPLVVARQLIRLPGRSDADAPAAVSRPMRNLILIGTFALAVAWLFARRWLARPADRGSAPARPMRPRATDSAGGTAGDDFDWLDQPRD